MYDNDNNNDTKCNNDNCAAMAGRNAEKLKMKNISLS